jgi:Arc/MetJ-type ribon-helix-helix transcriptional regulator
MSTIAVERHAHLIQLYLTIELGYELLDLDDLLLWMSRSPNARRDTSSDRQSVSVSLPPELVERLDRLVGDDVFGSRSERLRYGARLVVREEHLERLHEQADGEAQKDVEERLDRKCVSRP